MSRAWIVCRWCWLATLWTAPAWAESPAKDDAAELARTNFKSVKKGDSVTAESKLRQMAKNYPEDAITDLVRDHWTQTELHKFRVPEQMVVKAYPVADLIAPIYEQKSPQDSLSELTKMIKAETAAQWGESNEGAKSWHT